MKNLLLKRRFKVPLYDVAVWVVVAHDAIRAHNALSKRFKLKREEPGSFRAICVGRGNQFGLFFHADKICEDDIGHELTHCVEFIMDYIGNECIKCAEPRSYLNGYLHKRVYNLLRKHKITIHRS